MGVRNLQRWWLGLACMGACMTAMPHESPAAETLIPYLDSNNRFGFVNADGKLAISARYDGAKPFSEGRAAVAVADKWGYIDGKGRWVVAPRYSYASSYKDGVALAETYTPSTLVGGRGNGNSRAPFHWGLDTLNVLDNVLPWRHPERGAVYLLDSSGRILWKENIRYHGVPFPTAQGRDQDITPKPVKSLLRTQAYRGFIAMPPVESLYPIVRMNDEKKSRSAPNIWQDCENCDVFYADAKGNVPASTAYNSYSMQSNFSDNRLRVFRNGKAGFIDPQGQEVIATRFDHTTDFSEGYAWAAREGKIGLIDLQGEEIIDFHLDDAKPFLGGYAPVKKNQKWGVMNKQGELVVDYQYTEFTDRFGKYFVANRDGEFGVVDAASSRIIVPFAPRSQIRIIPSKIDSKFLIVTYENKESGWCMLDEQGNSLRCGYGNLYEPGAGLIVTESMGQPSRYGAIDFNGHIVYPNRYNRIGGEFSDGFALVELGDISFYIDAHGREYVSPALLAPLTPLTPQ